MSITAKPRAARRRRDDGGPKRLSYDEGGLRVEALTPTARGYAAVAGARDAVRSKPTGGSEDAHGRFSLDQLRDFSRGFDRNNAIYQAIVTRMLDVALGDGLNLQAKTDDESLDARIEVLWGEFWADPDVRGMDDGREVLRQIARQVIVDGDLGILRTDSGQIQIFPAELIASTLREYQGRQVYQGIELDENRKPVAFWVQSYGVSGEPTRGEGRRIAASAMDFVANRRRNEQTRGEPLMQAGFGTVQRLNDICDSEAAAWQVNSRFAMTATLENGGSDVDPQTQSDPEAGSSGDLQPRCVDIGSAMIFYGKPGEKLEGIKRDVPGPNFPESLKMFLRVLGMPIGMSLEFILLLWSDTNYSSGRASIKQVERGLRRLVNLVKRTLTRIYVWKVGQWVAAGELKPPAEMGAAIYAHRWEQHPYPAMDEQKEHDAALKRLEGGISSLTRENLRLGNDFAEIAREWQTELTLLADVCEAHNKLHPDQRIEVWQLSGLLKAPLPARGDGQAAAMDAAHTEDEPAAGADDQAQQRAGGAALRIEEAA